MVFKEVSSIPPSDFTQPLKSADVSHLKL